MHEFTGLEILTPEQRTELERQVNEKIAASGGSSSSASADSSTTSGTAST